MRRSIDRQKVRSIVRQYFFVTMVFSTVQACSFSTYSVFLMAKGLDLFEINLVNCFFMAGVFIMEIPTGAYADVLGRKNSFVAACCITGVGMLVYYSVDSFWGCVLAELIVGVGLSLHSGALEAWIVDSLRHVGVRGALHALFRKERYVGEVGIIAGSLFGGYIARYDLALPRLFEGVVFLLLGAIAAYIMREDYFVRGGARVDLSVFRTVIKDSIHYGIKRKSVLYVVAFGSLIVMCFQSLNMQWQIRFSRDFLFDTRTLGWMFVGISLFVMAGSFLSRKFMVLVGNEKRALILSQVITVIGILGASFACGPLVVLPAFLLHELGRGMITPLKRAYMNKRIPSKQRATILSFDSMIGKVGAFIGLLVGGGVAQRYSISAAWGVSAAVLAIIIPIFLKLKNGDG